MEIVTVDRSSFQRIDFPENNHIARLNLTNCQLTRFPWELVEKPDMELLNLRNNDFNLSDEEKMRLIKVSKTMNLMY